MAVGGSECEGGRDQMGKDDTSSLLYVEMPKTKLFDTPYCKVKKGFLTIFNWTLLGERWKTLKSLSLVVSIENKK